MKITALPLAICIFLTGCGWSQVTPDTADRTRPKLRFFVFYESTAWNSPSTARYEASSLSSANRCVYVNSPFRINVVALDEGGISSIAVGPHDDVPGISARNLEGDVVAGIVPNARMNGASPNPGLAGDVVRVAYFNGGPVYNKGSLSGVFELAPGRTVQFQASAKNFREGGAAVDPLTQITDYGVRLSEPGRPAGSACEIPPRLN